MRLTENDHLAAHTSYDKEQKRFHVHFFSDTGISPDVFRHFLITQNACIPAMTEAFITKIIEGYEGFLKNPHKEVDTTVFSYNPVYENLPSYAVPSVAEHVGRLAAESKAHEPINPSLSMNGLSSIVGSIAILGILAVGLFKRCTKSRPQNKTLSDIKEDVSTVAPISKTK